MNNNPPGFWTVIIIAFVIGLALLGGLSNNSTTTTTVEPNRGTAEHRYVTERFRQEGLNRADAQKAADAVIRFHEAQKK